MSKENPNPEKALETKRSKEHSKTCPMCKMYFNINNAQNRRKFCSSKCKMAYHRKYDFEGRYKAKKAPIVNPAPIEQIPVKDNLTAIMNEAWSHLVDET